MTMKDEFGGLVLEDGATNITLAVFLLAFGVRQATSSGGVAWKFCDT